MIAPIPRGQARLSFPVTGPVTNRTPITINLLAANNLTP